jgi:EAL domain-containing protein (putative c-di-GMP-specific phosphodiesterase class I)/GGDEF domain-containing protein
LQKQVWVLKNFKVWIGIFNTIFVAACVLAAILDKPLSFYFAGGGVLAICIGSVILSVYTKKSRGRLERIVSAVNALPETAFISYNYMNNKATVSDSMEPLTGFAKKSDEITSADYANFVTEIKSSPLSPEHNNIYMSPKPGIWVKVKTLATPSTDICVVNDATELVENINVIKSLKYYDIETGLMSRDATVKKLLSAIDSNGSAAAVMIFTVKGLDRLASFSGQTDASSLVLKIAEHIKSFENPHNTFAGRVSYSDFLIITTDTYAEGAKKFAVKITDAANDLVGGLKENSGKYAKVFCGYYVFGAEEKNLDSIMSAADFAAFFAAQSGSPEPVCYSKEDYERSAVEFAKLRAFDEVLSTNALDYHFQPVVSLQTAKIIGYEILMRPRKTGGFRFSPTEMLKLAVKHDRSYDIEKLTLFNSLAFLKNNREFFKGRKLFINIISDALLSDTDYEKLAKEYAGLLENAVMEVTETSYTDETSAELVAKRCRELHAQLALDDYGTGYSNGELLISLRPQFLKIDKKLVSGIDRDKKKRHLVETTIEFARTQSIMTVAEGVERPEELEIVSELGIDYVQGFFAARPSPVLVRDLAPDVRQIILSNYLKTRSGEGKLLEIEPIASAEDEAAAEYIYDLENIAAEGYSRVSIGVPNIRFIGIANAADICITVPASLKTEITFENVKLSAERNSTGVGALNLEAGADVTLKLVGTSILEGQGIRIPETAKLTLTGEGSLEVRATVNNGVAIGGTYLQDFGDIIIENEGKLVIGCTGDNYVGIGGGGQNAYSNITAKNTDIDLSVLCSHSVGIGTFTGGVKINLAGASVSGIVNGNESVGIGSLSGIVSVVAGGDINLRCIGPDVVGIGVLGSSESDIVISGGDIFMHLKSATACGIGSPSGKTVITIKDGIVGIVGEATKASGIGGFGAAGDVYIENGTLTIELFASERLSIGLKKGKCVIAGGNLNLTDGETLELYAPVDVLLAPQELTGYNDFFRLISIGDKSYSYRAKPNSSGTITAYLPINYKL